MNIVKKIFYFTYRINIKRNDKGTCLLTGFLMIWVVFFLNFNAIAMLCHLTPSFWDKIGKSIKLFILIYTLIAAYISYFHEDKFKMADIVKDYSPWKKPLVGGGIYILVSLIIVEVVLFVF